jgi:hypothetical protein
MENSDLLKPKSKHQQIVGVRTCKSKDGTKHNAFRIKFINTNKYNGDGTKKLVESSVRAVPESTEATVREESVQNNSVQNAVFDPLNQLAY